MFSMETLYLLCLLTIVLHHTQLSSAYSDDENVDWDSVGDFDLSDELSNIVESYGGGNSMWNFEELMPDVGFETNLGDLLHATSVGLSPDSDTSFGDDSDTGYGDDSNTGYENDSDSGYATSDYESDDSDAVSPENFVDYTEDESGPYPSYTESPYTQDPDDVGDDGDNDDVGTGYTESPENYHFVESDTDEDSLNAVGYRENKAESTNYTESDEYDHTSEESAGEELGTDENYPDGDSPNEEYYVDEDYFHTTTTPATTTTATTTRASNVKSKTRKSCGNMFDCDPFRTIGKRCVKRKLKCNGVFDCPNGYDELNCVTPLVGYLSNWREGKCSRTCGGGTRRDTRTCIRGRFYNLCIGEKTRVVDCNSDACPPPPGWTAWERGDCSTTCGQGVRVYTRTCRREPCPGKSLVNVKCNIKSCPEPSHLWGPWSVGECSATCGGGKRTDKRECRYGLCVGDSVRIHDCNNHPCPAKWGEWKKGKCSVTCGGGKRTDNRACLQGNCSGKKTRVLSCNKHACPVKAVWGNWTKGPCSKTCGGGERINNRTCLQGHCVGLKNKTLPCNTQECPAVWGEWMAGTCTKTCGGGKRVDTRKCLEGTCEGTATVLIMCNTQPCPVWSEWEEGVCTKSCGGGKRIDTRTCQGGSTCPGSAVRTLHCNTNECPVWGPWIAIGECSASCGAGVQTETRSCVTGDCGDNQSDKTRTTLCNTQDCPIAPEYSPWKYGTCSATCGGGKRDDVRFCIRGKCTQVLKRTVKCNEAECPGSTASWGRWQPGPCSVTCGPGKREYIRLCGGSPDQCPGASSVMVDCDEGACPPPTTPDETSEPSMWSTWSPWSPCSRTCGSGVQYKQRTCPNKGKCQGVAEMRKACHRKYCPVPTGEWTSCSRSCGLGTQMKVPFLTASDFRDCNLGDCPQEKCQQPFFARYGARNHTCCNVEPLQPGDVCGISSLQPGVGRLQSRIVGGASSRMKQWPWMVGVMVNGMAWCGATLIDAEWVMTAAHCVVYGTNTTLPLSSIRLKFGTVDLKETPPGNYWVQESGVSEVRFKDYRFPVNDIAFLRLENPPRITSHVQPICLPQGETLPDDTNCVAAGWGRLKENGENPDMLQEVEVRLLPDDMCALAYPRNFNKKIMKCAGKIAGGKDTCQGDSGGALMCQRCASCQWIAYGVVSFGDGCGLQHRPGVYARVDAYSTWINSIVQKELASGSHESCTSL